MSKSKAYLIVAVTGLIALLTSACASGVPSPAPAPAPAPIQANFRFLVSDQPNDIGDFEHLNVNISSLGLQLASDNGTWLQFSPDIESVDLIQLKGQNAQVIWSGNVTPGQYNKVFIYVSDVEGILTGDKGGTNVKLPSGKLQISKPFVVGEDSLTSFVFDITVIKAGQSDKYVLKPHIEESGADKEYSEVKEKDREQEQERERGRLQLRIEGDAQPGAEVVLAVMEQGQPVEEAAVEVNGRQIGTTDSEGEIGMTIPENTEEVEIRATLGEKSGELELEFEEEMEETELKGTITGIDGNIWTVNVAGVAKAVDVDNAEIEGSPQVGSSVEIKGVNNNGVIIAGEISVQKGEDESKKSSKDEDEDSSEGEGLPTIPHTLQGRDDCLACHGPSGIEPFPSNHVGRTNDVCTTCHQPSS